MLNPVRSFIVDTGSIKKACGLGVWSLGAFLYLDKHYTLFSWERKSIFGPALYIAKNLFSTLADVIKVGQNAWVNLHVPTKTGRR